MGYQAGSQLNPIKAEDIPGNCCFRLSVERAKQKHGAEKVVFFLYYTLGKEKNKKTKQTQRL